jgi:HPt (histidine-containing phosphotransfer) domain-containing protein
VDTIRLRALSAQFAELGRQYLASTGEEIACLDALAGRNDDIARRQVEQLAHRIHGTAATFNFGELSAAAAKVEKLARENARQWRDDRMVAALAELRRRLAPET